MTDEDGTTALVATGQHRLVGDGRDIERPTGGPFGEVEVISDDGRWLVRDMLSHTMQARLRHRKMRKRRGAVETTPGETAASLVARVIEEAERIVGLPPVHLQAEVALLDPDDPSAGWVLYLVADDASSGGEASVMVPYATRDDAARALILATEIGDLIGRVQP